MIKKQYQLKQILIMDHLLNNTSSEGKDYYSLTFKETKADLSELMSDVNKIFDKNIIWDGEDVNNVKLSEDGVNYFNEYIKEETLSKNLQFKKPSEGHFK